MAGMTSRERLLTALRCEEPDRVPFFEVAIDTAVALPLLTKPELAASDGGIAPELQTPPQYEGMVSIGPRFGGPGYDGLELVRGLGLDAIGAHMWASDARIVAQVDGHSEVVGGRVKTSGDLDLIQLPDPDDPALYEPLRRFIDLYRDTGLALFCVLGLCSDGVILSMGFETFALALYDDRALVEALFEKYSDWYARVVRHLCELDFDFFWVGDDVAHKSGPFVSPLVFRELFMPYYRRVAGQITRPWIFHSDGNLMPILDDLLELGMSGLHPIEPGAMDLGTLKRRYGDRLCLCGHISVDTLSRGTPPQVEALVREAIRVAAPGGGYMAGSSNSIAYYCQAENVRAMQRAIVEYGRYPIPGGGRP